MGGVIEEMKKTGRFSTIDFNALSEILKRRNYIVHEFFVNDLKHKNLETNPKQFFSYFEKTIAMMFEMNGQLNSIFASLKAEAKLIY
jgi:hypothetical protein